MGKSIRNLTAVTRVGLDLAKNAFQVHAVDARGEIVVARKLTRGRLVPFFAELAPCVVAMEACASAHHWGRALIELGHEVSIVAARACVKPYVPSATKNDAVDAAAICAGDGSSWPAVRAGAFDRQPGRSLMRFIGRASCSPASARRRSMLWRRPSRRDRRRRAARRAACL